MGTECYVRYLDSVDGGSVVDRGDTLHSLDVDSFSDGLVGSFLHSLAIPIIK